MDSVWSSFEIKYDDLETLGLLTMVRMMMMMTTTTLISQLLIVVCQSVCGTQNQMRFFNVSTKAAALPAAPCLGLLQPLTPHVGWTP